MPLKVLQYNDRVAEVQFICDCCGKIVKTSLNSRAEVEDKKDSKVICWHCKQAATSKSKA